MIDILTCVDGGLRIFYVMPTTDGSENKNVRGMAMSVLAPTKKTRSAPKADLVFFPHLVRMAIPRTFLFSLPPNPSRHPLQKSSLPPPSISLSTAQQQKPSKTLDIYMNKRYNVSTNVPEYSTLL